MFTSHCLLHRKAFSFVYEDVPEPAQEKPQSFWGKLFGGASPSLPIGGKGRGSEFLEGDMAALVGIDEFLKKVGVVVKVPVN